MESGEPALLQRGQHRVHQDRECPLHSMFREDEGVMAPTGPRPWLTQRAWNRGKISDGKMRLMGRSSFQLADKGTAARITALRIGAAGALLVCLSVAAIGIVMRSVPAGVSFQPSEAPVSLAEFVRPTNEHPGAALCFFTADSTLLIGYLAAFLGLYASCSGRAPRLALLGLATGIVMASADAVENTIYTSYALGALRGSPLAAPDTAMLYRVTGVKEASAGAVFLVFALATPATGFLGRLAVRLLLLTPLVGLLSLIQPALVRARGWALVAPMPLLAIWLWRQARHARSDFSS